MHGDVLSFELALILCISYLRSEDFINLVNLLTDCETLFEPLINIHVKLFDHKNENQVLLKTVEVTGNKSNVEVTDVDIDECEQILFLDKRVLMVLRHSMIFSCHKPS